MILEPVRIVSDWLKDETYGVNAQIAWLDSNGKLDGDTTPRDIAFIGNPTEDKIVAKWEAPGNKPAIYISLDGPADFDGEVFTTERRADQITIACRYITKHANPEDAVVETYHTLRAIVKSLKVLNQSDHDDDRTRNEVYLVAMTMLRAGPWFEEIGNSVCTGAVVVRFEAKDLIP